MYTYNLRSVDYIRRQRCAEKHVQAIQQNTTVSDMTTCTCHPYHISYTCTHIRALIYVHAYMYDHIRALIYVRSYTCVDIRVFIYVFICMRAGMCGPTE